MSYLVKRNGVSDAFIANSIREKDYPMKKGVPIPGVS